MLNETLINEYRNEFNSLGEMMLNDMPSRADHVLGKFSVGLCPNMQFIGWEALKNEDMPNGIKENGIHLVFKIDFAEKSVEVFQSGHIWLSKDEQKATNLAMVGMKRLLKTRGCGWFRKQKYKDISDLYNRMRKFYDKAMEIVAEYTSGYPYKQGIGWVDPSMNGKVA